MLRDVLIQKGLSNREAEVAELVSKGLSNKEVANQLFVTEKTVKFHLTNIYKKMSVKSRAQLIVWCLPHLGFIDNVQMAPAEVENTQPTTTNNSPGAASPSESSDIIPAGNATVGNSTIIPGQGQSGSGSGSIGF